MSENEEECEIFLIIGGNTDHSSQQLFLLSYQSLDVTCPVYYYHGTLAYMGKQQNGKRLMVYDDS